ncbi:MAG: hypothetical protein U9Q08_00570 [Candidatus Omnitrophota bacterium]|nr:hypothetical protein [Candidatus Omnitrophota bacterium]
MDILVEPDKKMKELLESKKKAGRDRDIIDLGKLREINTRRKPKT